MPTGTIVRLKPCGAFRREATAIRAHPQTAPAVNPPVTAGAFLCPRPGTCRGRPRGARCASARVCARGARVPGRSVRAVRPRTGRSQGEQLSGQQGGGHGGHRQCRYERGASALPGPRDQVGAGHRPARPRLVAGADRVVRRRPGVGPGEPGRAVRGRGRGDPSGLGVPADARSGDHLADQCARRDPGAGGGGRGAGAGAGARLVRGRVLAGPQGPRGGRVLADARVAGRRVLPGEGVSGAHPGRVRARPPRGAGGADAAGLPVQVGVGERAAPDLRRALPARPAGPARPAAVPAGHPGPAGTGPAHRRRRRGLSARGALADRARRLQPRRRAATRRHRARRTARRPPDAAAAYGGPLGHRRGLGPASAARLPAPVRRGAATAADGLHPGPRGTGLAAAVDGDGGAGGVPGRAAAGRRHGHRADAQRHDGLTGRTGENRHGRT
ncbi:hypothetical protein SGPA1_40813 [Streptomyces misionensis JCM 4497]